MVANAYMIVAIKVFGTLWYTLRQLMAEEMRYKIQVKCRLNNTPTKVQMNS